MTEITVIILTHNEARHIARAIASVQSFARHVLVVDSGSTDDTIAIARTLGVEVLSHPWTTHAAQFNWALDQVANRGGWILRLDADEIVTPTLAQQILQAPCDVNGYYVGRRICFMGQPVRYGGVFPVQIMRFFRNGHGRCEARWMDEHIVVAGQTGNLKGEIVDDNQNPLDWWVAKHNAYASREVIDVLNREYHFATRPDTLPIGRGPALKRFVKEQFYARLPTGARAGAYFFYRYVLRLGFLDGPQARAFHVLQGFWYRYLVDAKLGEVRRHIRRTGATPVAAIRDVLGVELDPQLGMRRRDAA